MPLTRTQLAMEAGEHPGLRDTKELLDQHLGRRKSVTAPLVLRLLGRIHRENASNPDHKVHISHALEVLDRARVDKRRAGKEARDKAKAEKKAGSLAAKTGMVQPMPGKNVIRLGPEEYFGKGRVETRKGTMHPSRDEKKEFRRKQYNLQRRFDRSRDNRWDPVVKQEKERKVDPTDKFAAFMKKIGKLMPSRIRKVRRRMKPGVTIERPVVESQHEANVALALEHVLNGMPSRTGLFLEADGSSPITYVSRTLVQLCEALPPMDPERKKAALARSKLGGRTRADVSRTLQGRPSGKITTKPQPVRGTTSAPLPPPDPAAQRKSGAEARSFVKSQQPQKSPSREKMSQAGERIRQKLSQRRMSQAPAAPSPATTSAAPTGAGQPSLASKVASKAKTLSSRAGKSIWGGVKSAAKAVHKQGLAQRTLGALGGALSGGIGGALAAGSTGKGFGSKLARGIGGAIGGAGAGGWQGFKQTKVQRGGVGKTIGGLIKSPLQAIGRTAKASMKAGSAAHKPGGSAMQGMRAFAKGLKRKPQVQQPATAPAQTPQTAPQTAPAAQTAPAPLPQTAPAPVAPQTTPQASQPTNVPIPDLKIVRKPKAVKPQAEPSRLGGEQADKSGKVVRKVGRKLGILQKIRADRAAREAKKAASNEWINTPIGLHVFNEARKNRGQPPIVSMVAAGRAISHAPSHREIREKGESFFKKEGMSYGSGHVASTSRGKTLRDDAKKSDKKWHLADTNIPTRQLVQDWI